MITTKGGKRKEENGGGRASRRNMKYMRKRYFGLFSLPPRRNAEGWRYTKS